jgi:hypothetical protein
MGIGNTLANVAFALQVGQDAELVPQRRQAQARLEQPQQRQQQVGFGLVRKSLKIYTKAPEGAFVYIGQIKLRK